MKNKEISFTGGLLKEALPLTSAVSSPNGPPLKIKNPYLQKKIKILYMKLDDDKHYIKVITFDEIYNYMVELFFM